MDLHNQQSIEDLVYRSGHGDEVAFHALYELLYDSLFRFVLVRVSSRVDAYDVLQEIFIDLWKALGKFSYQSDPQFYRFVYTIARRKVIRYYRSHKTIVEWNESYISENYEVSIEDFEYINKILRRLKPKYRNVLEMRYWLDLPFARIAQLLGIKESTIKVRHHRALRQLQKILNQHE